MSQFNKGPLNREGRGFGWNQYINFGKHKGKTYYDLSNEGDYKYLSWCLRNDINSAKDPTSFYIADSCIPHIRAALNVEGIKKTNWVKEYTEPDENGKISLHYVCLDQDRNQNIKSPEIEMKLCPKCGLPKTASLFNQGEGIYCSKCYTEQDLIHTNHKKVLHEIENEKGTKESYNRQPRNIYAIGRFPKSKSPSTINEHTEKF